MAFARALLHGLRLRCPRCGEGRIHEGRGLVARLRSACARCGLAFAGERGDCAMAVLVTQLLVVTLGLVGYAWLLGTGGRPPAQAQVAWVLGFAVLLPLLAYPRVRGAWLGTLYGATPVARPRRAPPW